MQSDGKSLGNPEFRLIKDSLHALSPLSLLSPPPLLYQLRDPTSKPRSLTEELLPLSKSCFFCSLFASCLPLPSCQKTFSKNTLRAIVYSKSYALDKYVRIIRKLICFDIIFSQNFSRVKMQVTLSLSSLVGTPQVGWFEWKAIMFVYQITIDWRSMMMRQVI